ncbi:MAG: 30S ribosomal protein S6 [Erysipelotrichaceae bacterium]
MKKYEVMYILNAAMTDENRQALIEKLHAIITVDGGKIENVDQWGIKDFAYEINHMKKGYYVVTTFEGTTAAVAEFGRIARIERDVVRYMMITKE